MRGLLTIALIVVAASTAAQLPGRSAARLPVSSAAAIVMTDVAIAYAPEDPRDGLEIEPWPEGGVAVGDTLGARVDYFTVVPDTIQLGVGGRLQLAAIQIATHGLDGDAVPRAPLTMSLEAPEGMLDIDLAVTEQALIALRPGIGRLWIESQLPRGTGTGEHYRLPVPIVVR